MFQLCKKICFSFFLLSSISSFAFAETVIESVDVIRTPVTRVDNILFLIDDSGSMNMQSDFFGTKRINVAKEVLRRINAKLPDLDYNIIMSTFSNREELLLVETPYNEDVFALAVNSIDSTLPIFGRSTNITQALSTAESLLDDLDGYTAIVMITDGLSNTGGKVSAEAIKLANKYGEKACLYVVAIDPSPEGSKIIRNMRSAFQQCTLGTNAQELLLAEGALDFYVSNVFYEEKVELDIKTREVFNIYIFPDFNFALGKWNITSDMLSYLEETKTYLQDNPKANALISGYTDNTGTAAYNLKVSNWRANAIKHWLVIQGIDANRLQTIGYGESNPEYTNDSKQGRALNRHVSIVTMK